MGKRTRKILEWVGYAAFGLLCVVLSLYFTFPVDTLARRLAQEVTRATRGQFTLTFDEAALAGLSGIRAQGVRLTYRPPDGTAPQQARIEEINFKLHLLPLLILRPTVHVSMEAGEGRLDVVAVEKSDVLELSVKADDLDVRRFPMFANVQGLPLSAKLDVELFATLKRLETPVNQIGYDLGNSHGKGTITVSTLRGGPGKIQGFSLPSLDFGTWDIKLALGSGEFGIHEFKQSGGVIRTRLHALSSLRPRFAHSTLDACVEFRPDRNFLQRHPNLQTALQLAEVQLRKDAQGFLHVPIIGSISRPRLRSGLCKKKPLKNLKRAGRK